MQTDNKKNATVSYSPVSAGVFGAVAGAAIGVGTAYILSDEKRRQKVGEVLQEMRVQALDTVREISEKSRGKVKVIQMDNDKKSVTDDDLDI